MVPIVIGAVPRCAPLDVAIVSLATVNACLGCLDQHATSHVLRTAGDQIASSSVTVIRKIRMDAIHRYDDLIVYGIASYYVVIMLGGTVVQPAQNKKHWFLRLSLDADHFKNHSVNYNHLLIT